MLDAGCRRISSDILKSAISAFEACTVPSSPGVSVRMSALAVRLPSGVELGEDLGERGDPIGHLRFHAGRRHRQRPPPKFFLAEGAGDVATFRDPVDDYAT